MFKINVGEDGLNNIEIDGCGEDGLNNFGIDGCGEDGDCRQYGVLSIFQPSRHIRNSRTSTSRRVCLYA